MDGTERNLSRDEAARCIAERIGTMRADDVYRRITRPAWDTSDATQGNYQNFWFWMPPEDVDRWVVLLANE